MDSSALAKRHKYLHKGGPEIGLTPYSPGHGLHPYSLAGEIRLQIYVNSEHDTHGTG